MAPKVFDNESRIQRITSSTIFIHGVQDTLIPSTHSEELYELSAATDKELCLAEEADHNYWIEDRHVLLPVKQFLDKYFVPKQVEKGTIGEIPKHFFDVDFNAQPTPKPSFISSMFTKSIEFSSSSIGATKRLFSGNGGDGSNGDGDGDGESGNQGTSTSPTNDI
eukprot:TRINITY_DN1957_c0_g4_i1.p2 TRINITY_DN1957_c0_g4~~TRINITY_DN1957_c0_g4_i1.p2  ORF type:complete len:165 (-),score=40.49 TRINITY_DN1957_c0_g4_i1:184-678(-)